MTTAVATELSALCAKVHDDRLEDFTLAERESLKSLSLATLSDTALAIYQELREEDDLACDYNPDVFPSLDAKLYALAVLTARALENQD